MNLNSRTNNVAESVNARIKQYIGRNISVSHFVRKAKDLIELKFVDLANVNNCSWHELLKPDSHPLPIFSDEEICPEPTRPPVRSSTPRTKTIPLLPPLTRTLTPLKPLPLSFRDPNNKSRATQTPKKSPLPLSPSSGSNYSSRSPSPTPGSTSDSLSAYESRSSSPVASPRHPQNKVTKPVNGRFPIGTKVESEFKENGVLQTYFGEVSRVLPKSYHVIFDDGDSRVYYRKDWKELKFL
jgi:hypothetical protein